MSKGGSSSTQQATDPRLVSAYLSNLDRARGVAGDLEAREFAPFTPTFNAGAAQLNQTVGGLGMDSTNQAAQAAAGMIGLNPSMINPINVSTPEAIAAQGAAAQAGPAALAETALADRGDIANVNAGSFLQGDIASYMSPYTDEVVNRALADLNRQREIQQIGVGDAAARAGAFGGTRHGVAEAETNRAFADQMATTAAGLRDQAFTTGAGLMQTDMDRLMQAGLANQGMDASTTFANQQAAMQAGLSNQAALNQMGQFDAGLAQQMGLANMDSLNQFGLANQSAAMQAALANQQAGMGAQQANQDAQLRAAGLDQASIGLLGGLGAQQQQMGLQGAGAMMDLGLLQQGFNQQQLDAIRNLPLEQQAVINEALGIYPPGAGGTTTSTERSDTFGNLISAGGAVLGGMATGGVGFFSDRRLKENIELVGEDEATGLPLYSFNYIDDQERRYVGVMADDVEKVKPEAVIEDSSGYKRVNYEALGLTLMEV